MLKKGLYAAIPFILALVLAFSLPASAQPAPVSCTDEPEYDQLKVAQVPMPWQFWAIEFDPDDPTVPPTLVDRIRISPTWLNPPPGQPQ